MGNAVGKRVRGVEGSALGNFVGVLGCTEGQGVGKEVGIAVGSWVGAELGISDGAVVGPKYLPTCHSNVQLPLE